MTAAEELRAASEELRAWVRDIPAGYWSPKVFVELSPALADWLDSAASRFDPEADVQVTDRSDELALSVARTVLGEEARDDA